MDRSAYEPGWGEVILGVVLSVGLGMVLGVFSLVMKPSVAVKEKDLPKDASSTLYYVEGSRDLNKAKLAAAKRKAFALGKTIEVTEDEINSFSTPPAPPANPAATAAAAKKKEGEKAPATKAPPTPAAPAAGTPAAAANSGDAVALGGPNFRIRDGAIQLAFPLTVNALELGLKSTVLTTGTFVKKGERFVFVPATLYVGSCPIHRLPFAMAYASKQVLSGHTLPDDISTPWGKLAGVAVEGSTLKLTMP